MLILSSFCVPSNSSRLHLTYFYEFATNISFHNLRPIHSSPGVFEDALGPRNKQFQLWVSLETCPDQRPILMKSLYLSRMFLSSLVFYRRLFFLIIESMAGLSGTKQDGSLSEARSWRAPCVSSQIWRATSLGWLCRATELDP